MKKVLVFIVVCIAALSGATALSVNMRAENQSESLDPAEMYQALRICGSWELTWACTTKDTHTRCHKYYCLVEE